MDGGALVLAPDMLDAVSETSTVVLAGERADAFACARSHCARFGGMLMDPSQLLADRVDVANGDDEAGDSVFDQVGAAAISGRYNRQPRRHGLDDIATEAVDKRRENVDVTARHRGRELRSRDLREATDADAPF